MHRILKNLKKPRSTAYKLYSVSARVLPPWLAKLLAVGNAPKLNTRIKLNTYDGSGQAVHPSAARFREKEYLACTPYPYGCEEYENPCLYIREEVGYKPVPGMFPILAPSRLGEEHYSDPWVGATEHALYLIFRRCNRTVKGKLDQLYAMKSADGLQWGSPTLILEDRGDALLSPMGDLQQGSLFCVEASDAKHTEIVRYAFDGTQILGEKEPCEIIGLDPEWFVWHIDGRYHADGAFYGCFMLMKKESPQIVSKLALFLRDGTVWRWLQDIPLSGEERDIVDFVYKSTFLDDTHLLCSARDKKGRFFLFRKALP